ncbi:MAG: SSI family serine proteinase inhibitor [Actinomycetota bacterium]|nr:SSI family serine proteinase inhibitor [Actinomycetota bacterium]
MDEVQLEALKQLPAPASCRVVDFEKAELVALERRSDQHVLIVAGMKPASMKVDLVPLVYSQQPEYWVIEVVGHNPGGIVLPASVPYTVSLPLTGLVGTQGVEVYGASRSERLAVAPTGGAVDSLGSFSLSVRSEAGDIIATAFLSCSPDGGSHPNAGAACKQLAEADGRIEAIPPQDGQCPPLLDPVVLSAAGTWNGEERKFEQEFPNRCVGTRDTGGVIFTFGHNRLASE